MTKVSPPETGTGLNLAVVVPSPSWPEMLPPQQYAAAPAVMPHVYENRALTAAKVSPPETGTGLDLAVVVPSPSWPELLRPQQYAVPPIVTPHV